MDAVNGDELVSECRLTNWLDMASEMRDARRHVCGPRVQRGGQSEHKDGKREAPDRHEGSSLTTSSSVGLKTQIHT